MSLVKVPEDLVSVAKNAIENNPLHFDRFERYALNKIINACEKGIMIDDVFIKFAVTALAKISTQVLNKKAS